MGYRLKDPVRLRPRSDWAELLGEAAALTGTIGAVWTDDRGDRVSVLYEAAQIFVPDAAAAEFVPCDAPEGASR